MHNQSVLVRTLFVHHDYEIFQTAVMELQLDAYVSEDIQVQLGFFHDA